MKPLPFAVSALLLLGMILGVRQLAGCHPAQTAEVTYTAALLRCVDKSETLAESKACRSLVDAQFGVDGGGK
jgi:hypothetical protein